MGLPVPAQTDLGRQTIREGGAICHVGPDGGSRGFDLQSRGAPRHPGRVEVVGALRPDVEPAPEQVGVGNLPGHIVLQTVEADRAIVVDDERDIKRIGDPLPQPLEAAD